LDTNINFLKSFFLKNKSPSVKYQRAKKSQGFPTDYCSNHPDIYLLLLDQLKQNIFSRIRTSYMIIKGKSRNRLLFHPKDNLLAFNL